MKRNGLRQRMFRLQSKIAKPNTYKYDIYDIHYKIAQLPYFRFKNNNKQHQYIQSLELFANIRIRLMGKSIRKVNLKI